ncbi:hypothetical protein [Stenotrophomonas forensis]|uniref:Uncharacterized protein n=1 Tax=Stenotrophomonas forensis TaxID=2871169 RepID=A0ABY7Y4D0_9GAMM|nr:hypothetical protein [Stenotrophomonas sp. DFS-20110405]WDM64827.1 hypothetical protein K5L94_05935 [Stenotrophomonas sp. DFS-20110405]
MPLPTAAYALASDPTGHIAATVARKARSKAFKATHSNGTSHKAKTPGALRKRAPKVSRVPTNVAPHDTAGRLRQMGFKSASGVNYLRAWVALTGPGSSYGVALPMQVAAARTVAQLRIAIANCDMEGEPVFIWMDPDDCKMLLYWHLPDEEIQPYRSVFGLQALTKRNDVLEVPYSAFPENVNTPAYRQQAVHMDHVLSRDRPSIWIDPDWTKHPVLVVGGAVSATLVICLTYFNQFALPQRTARLEDQAANATEEAGKLKEELVAQEQLTERTQKEVTRLKSREEHLSSLLLEARTVDVFVPGTGYPSGFATAKVGMKEADMHSAYPKGAVEVEEMGYLTVNLANSPFGRAVYYFDESGPDRRVSHIRFSLKLNYGKEHQDIVKRISESLGKPLMVTTKYYAWPARDGTDVLVTDSDGLMIIRQGHRPTYWLGGKEYDALCKKLAKSECLAGEPKR